MSLLARCALYSYAVNKPHLAEQQPPLCMCVSAGSEGAGGMWNQSFAPFLLFYPVLSCGGQRGIATCWEQAFLFKETAGTSTALQK